jgi:hypothetical protein
MPFLLVPLLLIAVVLMLIVLIPVSLVQRYRLGTRRQPVRGWLATMNVAAFALSTALFVVSAAVTSHWVPRAFSYTMIGLAGGLILGLLGLALTRWEGTPHSLHYTPNRLLVLAIVATVAARLSYGAWRAWHSWGPALDGASWLTAWGAANALGAGALVLGYYLTYWSGLRRRFQRHRRSHSVPGFDDRSGHQQPSRRRV